MERLCFRGGLSDFDLGVNGHFHGRQADRVVASLVAERDRNFGRSSRDVRLRRKAQPQRQGSKLGTWNLELGTTPDESTHFS